VCDNTLLPGPHGLFQSFLNDNRDMLLSHAGRPSFRQQGGRRIPRYSTLAPATPRSDGPLADELKVAQRELVLLRLENEVLKKRRCTAPRSPCEVRLDLHATGLLSAGTALPRLAGLAKRLLCLAPLARSKAAVPRSTSSCWQTSELRLCFSRWSRRICIFSGPENCRGVVMNIPFRSKGQSIL